MDLEGRSLWSRPNRTATPPRSPATAGTGEASMNLEIAICTWVEWWSTERLHGELADRTPAEIEAAYHRDHNQADAA
jgi:hypothetical protein